MDSNSKDYVVKASRPGKPDRFYSVDSASGGYPVYLAGLGSADFLTEEDARKVLDRIRASVARPQVYTDGERRPNFEISAALDLSNTCLEETVTFSVCRAVLESTGDDLTFTGRVERPSGFKYK